jgi:hypothetical protein
LLNNGDGAAAPRGLVGMHGAMNPAGKVRCNMWRQIELCNGDCNFTTLRRKIKTPPRKGLTTEAGFCARYAEENSPIRALIVA